MTMLCKVNVFSSHFVFSFVWLVVISSLSSSLFSSIYFSVIKFFFVVNSGSQGVSCWGANTNST